MKRLFFILGVTAFFSFSPLLACLQKGIEVGNPNLEGKVVTLESAGTAQSFRLEFGPPEEVWVTKIEEEDLETFFTQYTLVSLEVSLEASFSDGTDAKFNLLINESGDFISATLALNGQTVPTTFQSETAPLEEQTLSCPAAAPNVLNEIAGALCSRIVSCTTGSSCPACDNEVMNLNGLAASFGVNGNQSLEQTLPDLEGGQITVEGTALEECIAAIEKLPCSVVSLSVQPNDPTTFNEVKGILPKPFCAKGILKKRN